MTEKENEMKRYQKIREAWTSSEIGKIIKPDSGPAWKRNGLDTGVKRSLFVDTLGEESDDVFSKKFWLSWNVQSEKWCGEMHICENVIERLFACLTYIVFPATHYYMVETWICCYCTETTSMCLSGTPVWLAAPCLHTWRTSYHLLFATPSKKPSSLIHANFCPNTIITPSLHCVTPIHA